MSEGSERSPEPRTSSRGRAVVAVVLLVAAGLAPSVGVGLATGDRSAGQPFPSGPWAERPSTDVPAIPDPTTGTDNDTRDPDDGTTLPTIPAPSVTSVPETTRSTTDEPPRSPTTESTTPSTGEPTTTRGTSATTAEPTHSPTTDSPTTGSRPTTDERSTETSTERPADPGGPPNGAPGRGPGGDRPGPPDDPGRAPSAPGPGGDAPAGPGPGGDGPPGVGGPPNAGHDAPPNAGERGPPVDRPANHTDRTGPPENRTRGPSAAGPPGLAGSNRSVPATVNATVENATPNESVSVNVSSAAREDDASFSSLNVTPERGGSFSLNVTASGGPIPGKTPSVDLSNGTRPLAYLSVDHSIDDENVSDVAFTFRVRKERVNDSERGDVALYRFREGTWNELPTTLVRTTERHYVYRGRSPGLSEFAAGKQHPEFEIVDASASPASLSPGDGLDVRVRVENRGEADGTFTAELALDGESVERRLLTVASGGMRQATFERRPTEPGTHEVVVNDHRVGEVTVRAPPTDDGSARHPSNDEGTTRDASQRDATETNGIDAAEARTASSNASDLANYDAVADVPGFRLGVAAVVLLVGLIARRRWQ